ncbi:cell wall hydrolase [Anaerobacillus isosaccharinicus]|uniref:Spore cortex-lytic enzyme n=1 Tax=Anaerobacillus isosaccharinicus TaxID=1532552 RepID=A0A1S2KVX3_9BACI|nr:cell wall hydrolase [Anaerobacillus isosaccharinicus]MBA5585830.1 cell wall hydrolase [Anaerobacillus isosaccharinicus]QOY35874.1 cell wall hydrolase [Anaerobacillus isosaccharinicus]
MNKTVKTIPLLITICFMALSTLIHASQVSAFSDQIIQRGATGDDVVELQSRLQYIGFYNETIDGVYGWGTYWAVRKYQDEFGLEVDGLVGPKMKAMLEKSTDFDYEWVHKQFHEGRKFTHYGKTPKEIQSGPEGSRIPPLEQARRQQQPGQTPAARTPEGTPTPGTPAVPGETPTPGTPAVPGETPTPGTPAVPGETPTPGTPAVPGETPAPGAPAVPGETPAPGAPAVPEGEPVPGEEAPEQEADEEDGPNIEEAINTPAGFSENDIRIMAQAVYGEARGEPYIGQVAVAAVIMNRIASPTFPNTPSGVIFEPRAFTAVADGQIYLEPNETARRAVLDAINGQDPSGNALYYFNPDTATSGWIWTRPQIKKIGKHIFCK